MSASKSNAAKSAPLLLTCTILWSNACKDKTGLPRLFRCASIYCTQIKWLIGVFEIWQIFEKSCQGCSSKLVVKVGRQGRSSRYWSSRLVFQIGCQDWSLRLVIKAGRKDWSSRLVVKVGLQSWSSRLLSLHHRARVVGQFSICFHMTIIQGHQYEFFPLKYFRLDYFIQSNWPLGFAFNFNRRLLGTHIYLSSTFNWLQSLFKTTFSLYKNELSLNFNKSSWKWMCQNDMYSLSLGSKKLFFDLTA